MFASLVLFMAAAKKENALEDVALVAGTQQNLSNLYSLDIYGSNTGLILLLLTCLMMQAKCHYDDCPWHFYR